MFTQSSQQQQQFTQDDFIAATVEFLLQSPKYRQFIHNVVSDVESIGIQRIVVSMFDFLSSSPLAAEHLLLSPTTFLPLLPTCSQRVQQYYLTQFPNVGEVKQLNIRISELPCFPSMMKQKMNEIRSADVGKLITLNATVIRTSAIRLLEYSRTYQCRKCEHIFTNEVDTDNNNRIEQPKHCPHRGVRGGKCKSTSFQQIDQRTDYRDYQRIKIQEPMERLSVGSMPKSITVVLQDDLVDSCKAGNDITLTALVRQSWRSSFQPINTRCDIEVYLEAQHIKVNNDKKSLRNEISEEMKDEFKAFWLQFAQQPISARNHIIAQVCPSLYGLFMVKLATLLTLIGGVPNVTKAVWKSLIEH